MNKMKCQKVKKRLVLYVGDDLPARKKELIESHLEHCPACMAELDELRKMKQSLREMALQDVPDSLHPGFPEKVARIIRQTRLQSPFWFMRKPVRVAGVVALGIVLFVSVVLFFLIPDKISSDRLIKEIISISDTDTGSSELVWDPEHIFFRAFDGPYRLDSWEAPRQSGVYAVLHKTTSDEGPVTYIIDYCGQGRNLSSYKGYPWIQHRMKRLVARTGSKENVYIAVFLMPDSSKQERRQIEKALLKTFNPYFNRGV
jgi:hypothetical protein